MARKKPLDDLPTAELEQALYARKRAETEGRVGRLRAEGRVVDPPGGAPLVPPSQPHRRGRRSLLRRLADSALLLVEVAAVVALLAILASLWLTNRQLNSELAAAQRAVGQSLAVPTPTAPPVIDVVVLPSGHRPPVDGQQPQPGEAGPIPAHLLPAINAYVPPPVPTPGPEQARRLEIASINVNHPIVQGDDWEQLKKGVGQTVTSGQPGQPGNVVLSAHNDIYGEIFRYLDKLQPGDEVIVSTERQAYTYIVDEVRVVAPTDVWVMAPTEDARVTLISCYPYRVNTSRIVVFGRLAEPEA